MESIKLFHHGLTGYRYSPTHIGIIEQSNRPLRSLEQTSKSQPAAGKAPANGECRRV